jgi:hypothetical protein
MGVKINGFLKFFFYLFSFISYLSEALFEPLLAPKQHLAVTTAAAQAPQRLLWQLVAGFECMFHR